MVDTFHFLTPELRSEAAQALSSRGFTRKQVLEFTEPRIDSGQLTNWARRDLFNPSRQVPESAASGTGTAPDLEEKACGARQRYLGNDVLQVMTLCAISHAGLPFALAEEIIGFVLERAADVTGKPAVSGMVVVASYNPHESPTPRAGEGYTVDFIPITQAFEPIDDEIPDWPDWSTVIHIDRIIARFLRKALRTDKRANVWGEKIV